MKKEEAERLRGKRIKVVLSNKFNFSGTVLDVTEDTLILLDKFNSEVSISLAEIVICTGERR